MSDKERIRDLRKKVVKGNITPEERDELTRLSQEEQKSNRERLDSCLLERRSNPHLRNQGAFVRIDGETRVTSSMTDRQAAFALLATFRIDGDETPHLQGIPLKDCSDAYVIQYALCKAGDDAPIELPEWRLP